MAAACVAEQARALCADPYSSEVRAPEPPVGARGLPPWWLREVDWWHQVRQEVERSSATLQLRANGSRGDPIDAYRTGLHRAVGNPAMPLPQALLVRSAAGSQEAASDMYCALLGLQPDASGLAAEVSVLAAGVGLACVARRRAIRAALARLPEEVVGVIVSFAV